MAKKKTPVKRIWVSLTLPHELVQQIDEEAEKEIRQRAQMIRVLLLRALAAEAKSA